MFSINIINIYLFIFNEFSYRLKNYHYNTCFVCEIRLYIRTYNNNYKIFICIQTFILIIIAFNFHSSFYIELDI